MWSSQSLCLNSQHTSHQVAGWYNRVIVRWVGAVSHRGLPEVQWGREGSSSLSLELGHTLVVECPASGSMCMAVYFNYRVSTRLFFFPIYFCSCFMHSIYCFIYLTILNTLMLTSFQIALPFVTQCEISSLLYVLVIPRVPVSLF